MISKISPSRTLAWIIIIAGAIGLPFYQYHFFALPYIEQHGFQYSDIPTHLVILIFAEIWWVYGLYRFWLYKPVNSVET